MRILLTGFEPFNNSPINPSQEALQRLESCPPAGFELYTAILPVDHRHGPEALLHHLATVRATEVIPAGFIHLPKLPEQAAALKLARLKASVVPSMSMQVQVRGLEAGLKGLIQDKAQHPVETLQIC